MKKIIILLLAVILVVGGVWYYSHLFGSVTLKNKVEVIIPEASTSEEIGVILADKGVIRSAFAFKLQVKKNGVGAELKAGTYDFKGTCTLSEVIETLVKGPALSGEKITVPEGYSQKQIIALLVSKGLVTEAAFLDAAANGNYAYDYLPAAGDSQRLEGFLYPETYYIAKDDSAAEIISMMLEEFDAQYGDEWQARVNELGLTPKEWVTMASIVEKEAVVEKDRPIIAGVFYNRLNLNMLLQSCATVQYALGETKSVLTNEDVQIDSAYNTYIHYGLPPGPIASPGHDSLYAALYPTDTDNLYFVAKPNGEHIFSKTYEEHLSAKAAIENGEYDNE
ncbi:MAG TPA: endolytic transglycosylase MltG [Clostridiales bacterium]|nr:endolytic transglycosylase MltG [Clostridiales bacterium]